MVKELLSEGVSACCKYCWHKKLESCNCKLQKSSSVLYVPCSCLSYWEVMQVNAQASFHVKELSLESGCLIQCIPKQGEVGRSRGFPWTLCQSRALSTFGHPCHWSEGSTALPRQYWMNFIPRRKGSPRTSALNGNFGCRHQLQPHVLVSQVPWTRGLVVINNF